MIYSYIGLIAGVLLAILAAGYGVFVFMSRQNRKREQLIISILEDCVWGKFDFIEDDELLEKLGPSAFSDMLVKLAHSLQLKRMRLDEEQDSMKALVSDISHQLKTPISAMKVCRDIYLESDDEEEKREFMERSAVQIDKLETLIAALINISRLESKAIVLNKEETTVIDILTEAINAEYYKALAKNIEIEVEEFDDIKLALDKKWTAEAISNILDNGIKYSPESSIIKIRIEKLYSFVRLEIIDEGIGVPKEERNKIFMRFFRGRHELIKEQEGSGIGLYLTRKILEDQGGTVSVRPGKNCGSIFVVQLPL